MIEYANEFVIKLLKQYDMLSKSLNFTTDLTQNKEIDKVLFELSLSRLETSTAYLHSFLFRFLSNLL